MNVFYANCKAENWDACKKNNIFGLRKQNLPNIEKGDLILARITGTDGHRYGVNALWVCEHTSSVGADTYVPWTDAEYSWIVHFKILVGLSRPFSEEFATSSKLSQKIEGLFSTRLMGAMGELKPIEAARYLQSILEEFRTELERKNVGGTGGRSSFEVIQDYCQSLGQSKLTIPKPIQTNQDDIDSSDSATEEKELRQASFGVVGERIDLPILNYAPLNEMGVILLFGYYMKDLGFSHLEEIRADFPDAIGMQQIDSRKYRRVRIEFEYKSRNFVTHRHPVDQCDVIVCWENNWSDCPIEVIELKKILFEK